MVARGDLLEVLVDDGLEEKLSANYTLAVAGNEDTHRTVPAGIVEVDGVRLRGSDGSSAESKEGLDKEHREERMKYWL